MPHIEIEWLTDDHDCDTCGTSYAEGARVKIDGVLALDMTPSAHCFGGAHHSDADVFTAILRHLGHTVEITEDE